MKWIFIAIAFFFSNHQDQANSLVGQWDNKKGQLLSLHADGTAWWIFYSDTKRDSFAVRYVTDLTQKPHHFDLTNFKKGPLTGKTLFGIIEFVEEDTFKFDCELVKENRPKDFSSSQTQTYYRLRN